ncbi:TlpA family protein disulfide reductase [Actinoplanes regularis]|uniref:Thiol-disulfide isomerase or thioredoxin n=1 Tax=Actinoplanes regularis TaxID=52697 RepID=A0A239ART1_9ACTN|nr:TlpA disulfide reductase family protein [Actinoplanes regularis]GIE87438.1 thiol:disulfide interchange protein [Actinoplanes regularis]SNR97698.1 Thiol-disulfide isomerase or thioredoxin [Actinoplanes regularis]
MRLGRILPVVAAAVLLTGCTATPTEPEPPSPFAACAAQPGGGTELPDVSLACFTGDGQIRLADLRGPAVINIWASYCGPCRQELPVIQRLADATAGRLTVLGVDTNDTRTAAASFGADHGVSMPTLFDPDRKLVTALGVVSLPSTVFVDAAGKMYVHRYPMDAADLTEQVREHTGLEVRL